MNSWETGNTGIYHIYNISIYIYIEHEIIYIY